MTPTDAKKRHDQLVHEIREHDHAYYVLAQPVISDQEYDRLYRELVDLEQQFPELCTPDSPSQRVGGAPLKEFQPVHHLKAMMSLDNTYSQDELREFVARVQRLLRRIGVTTACRLAARASITCASSRKVGSSRRNPLMADYRFCAGAVQY